MSRLPRTAARSLWIAVSLSLAGCSSGGDGPAAGPCLPPSVSPPPGLSALPAEIRITANAASTPQFLLESESSAAAPLTLPAVPEALAEAPPNHQAVPAGGVLVLGDGYHHLTVGSGCADDWRRYVYLVDTVAPTVTIFPDEGSYPDAVTVQFEVDEPFATLATRFYPAGATSVGGFVQAGRSLEINTPGLWQVEARATDRVGNVGPTAAVTLEVLGTPVGLLEWAPLAAIDFDSRLPRLRARFGQAMNTTWTRLAGAVRFPDGPTAPGDLQLFWMNPTEFWAIPDGRLPEGTRVALDIGELPAADGEARGLDAVPVTWTARTCSNCSHVERQLQRISGPTVVDEVVTEATWTLAITPPVPGNLPAIGAALQREDGSVAVLSRRNEGSDASIAIDAGGFSHAAWRDETGRNLRYATNATGSWVIETVDSGADVGRYTSIALDGNGDAHIAYYDAAGGSLRYANNTGGTWSLQTVDADGDTGRHASLAIDGSNRVHIAWRDESGQRLRYAHNVTGPWAATTVDDQGDVGNWASLGLDSGGNAHIAYQHVFGNNSDLRYAHNITGPWHVTTLETGGSTGWYASLAIDINDAVHVAMQDAAPDTLRYTENVTGTWQTMTVAAMPGSGTWAALAVDSNTRAHIAWYDPFDRNLRYSTNTSGSWTTVTLDDGGDVGSHAAIAVDGNDDLRVLALDATRQRPVYASNVGGPWTVGRIEETSSLARITDHGDGSHFDISVDTAIWPAGQIAGLRIEATPTATPLWLHIARRGSNAPVTTPRWIGADPAHGDTEAFAGIWIAASTVPDPEDVEGLGSLSVNGLPAGFSTRLLPAPFSGALWIEPDTPLAGGDELVFSLPAGVADIHGGATTEPFSLTVTVAAFDPTGTRADASVAWALPADARLQIVADDTLTHLRVAPAAGAATAVWLEDVATGHRWDTLYTRHQASHRDGRIPWSTVEYEIRTEAWAGALPEGRWFDLVLELPAPVAGESSGRTVIRRFRSQAPTHVQLDSVGPFGIGGGWIRGDDDVAWMPRQFSFETPIQQPFQATMDPDPDVGTIPAVTDPARATPPDAGWFDITWHLGSVLIPKPTTEVAELHAGPGRLDISGPHLQASISTWLPFAADIPQFSENGPTTVTSVAPGFWVSLQATPTSPDGRTVVLMASDPDLSGPTVMLFYPGRVTQVWIPRHRFPPPSTTPTTPETRWLYPLWIRLHHEHGRLTQPGIDLTYGIAGGTPISTTVEY